MKIGAVLNNDLANGPGVRLSVFVSGCPHHCFNCHNPTLWDKEVGTELTDDLIDRLIELLKKDGIKRGLSILGGEPFAPYNVDGVEKICARIRKEIPDISIWVWSGYEFSTLNERSKNEPNLKKILKQIDVIVDGPYIDSLKGKGNHPWRGSANQHIWYKAIFNNYAKLIEPENDFIINN